MSGPRKMRRMDAAVAMDAKTASTATWKTAQNAVSHSAHPHYSLHALHTKNLTLPGLLLNFGREAIYKRFAMGDNLAESLPGLRSQS